MDASRMATIAIESGRKFDVLLRWGALHRWRRICIVLALALALISGYYVTLRVSSEQSSQEGAEAAERYERASQEDLVKAGMESAEQCSIARQSGSTDAEIHCPVADRLYADARLGILEERRQQVLAAHAYSAMVLDYRQQLRRIEMAWDRDHNPGVHGKWMKALVSPVGVILALAVQVLLYGAVVFRIEQLARAATMAVSRPLERDQPGEDDVVVGDVPNLPYERIHHPDRR